MESVWAKPFTFDVEDAAEEPTTCRRNAVQHVVTENPQKSGAILGKTRKLLAKEHVSRALVYDLVYIKHRLVTIYCDFSLHEIIKLSII